MAPQNDECILTAEEEAMDRILYGYLDAARKGEDAFQSYKSDNANIPHEEFRERDEDEFAFNTVIVSGIELRVFVDDDGRHTAYLQEYA